jgi:hypothetical protein
MLKRSEIWIAVAPAGVRISLTLDGRTSIELSIIWLVWL